MAGTVTVACKLPNGILLHLHEWTTVSEPVVGGGMRDVRQSRRIGEPVKINGVAHEVGKAPPALMVGGYALTPGVDADFWARWYADFKDSDLIRNNVLFAHEKPVLAEGFAREHAAQKSGLEPLDPTNLPRTGIGGRVQSFDGKNG